MSDSQQVMECRKRKRIKLVQLFGDKCSLCGYNRCSAALEFHHINPEEKDFELSMSNSKSLEKNIEEAKKCILICANCHREIHNGLYEGVDLFQYQHISSDLLIELEKEKEELVCKNCGAPITIYSKSGLCVSCAQSSKYRTRIDNKPTREQLKALIRNKSFLEIGRMYEVSDNAIRKWCDKEQLPRTKKDIQKYTDKEWEEI